MALSVKKRSFGVVEDTVVFMDMSFMMAPSYLEIKAESSLSGRHFVFCIRKRKEGCKVAFELIWPIVLRERVV